MPYPEYPGSILELEDAVLAQWREEGLFARTLEKTAGGPEFVFFEGPPTANGRPGIHHVLSRTIKDLVCRYHTMRGEHVTRIAGWDTHGLPVEIEAEKKLGISGKREIEAVGVARFNEVCRESVFTYKEDWERLSERIAYWLDYSKPYVTFTPSYIETIWWILKQFDDKGLLYRGHKSVPYCPRCGTALSSHEVAQGYEDVQDPSLYFMAPILGNDGSDDRRAFLVWTTTPWTLPSNAALAIHPELTYAEVEHDGRGLILAEARVQAVFGDDAVITRRYAAAELMGTRYLRPFDLIPPVAGNENAWQVLPAEFVSADDGTGIVHLAPAFGADDFAAGQKHGLPMFRPIDDAGKFAGDLALVGGMFVKDADPILIDDLKARGLVFRSLKAWHSYPHCWRCGTPLIYMARDSWYLRTTSIKEVMLQNNAQVSWHPPEVGTGRFGEWLEGNVDWALSRERYWGTPLPAWVCDKERTHVHVIGSFADLAEKVGPLPANFDPHKPYIDEYAFTCTQCDGTMRRTPEVIDVWFDSGSMPYAQWHYPFENREQFEKHFPADFICEGVDQTRGWFYSLMAISSMLGMGPAYRSVTVNDLVLDAQGQKMSKSKGNVVDPWEAIGQFGADAIRWYFVTASQPWVAKRFDPEALGEARRRTFDTLANTYRFYALYANLEKWQPSDQGPPASARPVIDRWIVSRLNTLVADVVDDFNAYEITRAARRVADFVVDDVSNWYVRRSRDRFWGSADAEDTRAAFRTLADTLETTTRLLAPVTPLVADWLHRALTGGESVHLDDFPKPDDAVRSATLESSMEAVRVLARLGRAARESVKIRVRQPLRVMHAVVPQGTGLTEELLEILRDELNVKEVRFLEAAEDLVSYRAVPNFRTLGKRFGPRTQRAADAIRALDAAALGAIRSGAGASIELDGETLALGLDEVQVHEDAKGDLIVEADGGFTIALDPTLDDELRREGLARELVNRIQNLRKKNGLKISDRILLGVFAEPELLDVARVHWDYVAGETLATELVVGGTDEASERFDHRSEVEIEGQRLEIGLKAV
jgi:isoleucyl-tRNA synthetase